MLGNRFADTEARRRGPLHRQGLTTTSFEADRASRCWRCDHAIDATDRYCRACGEGQGAALAWYYRPVWIALLSLSALGPFAVILIWRTPALGRTTKWVASIALVALSLWVTWNLVVDVQTLLDF